MGLRYRKSFKAGPVRITTSKSGVSTSIGGKGARITKTASGKTRTTLSVPGTGLSYVSETGGKKSKGKAKALSPEYTAAVRHVQDEATLKSHQAAVEAEARMAERQSYKQAEREPKQAARAECLTKNPPKPPKSITMYYVAGVMFLILGVLSLLLFWPFGLVCIAFGIWYLASAPKIYKGVVERYQAVHPEFGQEDRNGD